MAPRTKPPLHWHRNPRPPKGPSPEQLAKATVQIEPDGTGVGVTIRLVPGSGEIMPFAPKPPEES